jgi:hypothetical protein
MTPQQCRNVRLRLVSSAQPDHFGRRAQQRRHFGEIDILRHDREAVGLGIVPHIAIVSLR